MKVGSFVGVNGTSLNKDEISAIKRSINDGFNTYLSNIPNVCGVNISAEKDYSKSISIYAVVHFRDFCVMRHCNGDCFIPHCIRVNVYKQNGYDESKDVPRNEMSSYSLKVDMIGDYRRYRCRNIQNSVGITPTTYEYGTELSDLDIPNAFSKIATFLRCSKSTNIKF